MAIARVQGTTITRTGASKTATSPAFGSTTGAGNLLIGFAWGTNDTLNHPTTYTFTCSNGDRCWTAVASERSGSTDYCAIGFCFVVTTGTPTLTFTQTSGGSSPGDCCIFGMEFSGLATSSVEEQNGATSGTNGDVDSGTSITTVSANSLFVSCAVNNNDTATFTANSTGSSPSSGWTIEQQLNTTGQRSGCGAYVIVSSTQTARCTYSMSTSGGWAGTVATFKIFPPADAAKNTPMLFRGQA